MHALVHGVCMQGGVWVCSGVAVSGNSSWLGRVGLCRDAHMTLSLVDGFHSSTTSMKLTTTTL